ncbi:MAG TPA: DUF1616 domain-containing protein [Methanothrix sp.]|nr:DUF1616 domain-containing protein [Methanothrix sp.]
MSDFRDLMAIMIFVVIAALFIMVPPLNDTPIRAVLGLPLVLFVPGYVLISALFPEKTELDLIERLALSMGLSICVVIFIGLGLNYTPWGIRLGPILFFVAAVTFGLTAISAYRRIRMQKPK